MRIGPWGGPSGCPCLTPVRTLADATLVDPSTRRWSLIVKKVPSDTSGACTPEISTFALGGSLAEATTLAVWMTQLALAADGPVEADFVRLADVLPVGASFSLNVSCGQIYTVTNNLEAGNKGEVPSSSPPAAFPPVYADDFDTCPLDSEPDFITDMNGSFQCEDVRPRGPLHGCFTTLVLPGVDTDDPAHGVVLQQNVPAAPIRWWTDTRPHAVLGDVTWEDVDLSIEARCTNAGAGVIVGARGSALGDQGPHGISNEDEMPGVWMSVGCVGGENGPGLAPWSVTLAVADVLTPSKAVAAGVLGIPFVPGEWHTLRLVLVGAIASGFVDGAQIFTGLNVSAAPAQGWVGFGTPRFGDFSQFGA